MLCRQRLPTDESDEYCRIRETVLYAAWSNVKNLIDDDDAAAAEERRCVQSALLVDVSRT